MAKHFIAQMHMKKGAFTEAAKRRGETPAQLQAEVLAPGSHASEHLKRQARLRQVLVHLPRYHGGK